MACPLHEIRALQNGSDKTEQIVSRPWSSFILRLDLDIKLKNPGDLAKLRADFDKFIENHQVEGADPRSFEIILHRENKNYCNVFDGDIITERNGENFSTLCSKFTNLSLNDQVNNLTIISQSGNDFSEKISLKDDSHAKETVFINDILVIYLP